MRDEHVAAVHRLHASGTSLARTDWRLTGDGDITVTGSTASTVFSVSGFWTITTLFAGLTLSAIVALVQEIKRTGVAGLTGEVRVRSHAEDQEEYVVLASARKTLDLSGWTLTNARHLRLTLPQKARITRHEPLFVATPYSAQFGERDAEALGSVEGGYAVCVATGSRIPFISMNGDALTLRRPDGSIALTLPVEFQKRDGRQHEPQSLGPEQERDSS